MFIASINPTNQLKAFSCVKKQLNIIKQAIPAILTVPINPEIKPAEKSEKCATTQLMEEERTPVYIWQSNKHPHVYSSEESIVIDGMIANTFTVKAGPLRGIRIPCEYQDITIESLQKKANLLSNSKDTISSTCKKDISVHCISEIIRNSKNRSLLKHLTYLVFLSHIQNRNHARKAWAAIKYIDKQLNYDSKFSKNRKTRLISEAKALSFALLTNRPDVYNHVKLNAPVIFGNLSKTQLNLDKFKKFTILLDEARKEKPDLILTGIKIDQMFGTTSTSPPETYSSPPCSCVDVQMKRELVTLKDQNTTLKRALEEVNTDRAAKVQKLDDLEQCNAKLRQELKEVHTDRAAQVRKLNEIGQSMQEELEEVHTDRAAKVRKVDELGQTNAKLQQDLKEARVLHLEAIETILREAEEKSKRAQEAALENYQIDMVIAVNQMQHTSRQMIIDTLMHRSIYLKKNPPTLSPYICGDFAFAGADIEVKYGARQGTALMLGENRSTFLKNHKATIDFIFEKLALYTVVKNPFIKWNNFMPLNAANYAKVFIEQGAVDFSAERYTL